MRIETIWRCPVIDHDVACEACTCVEPCQRAYLVHVLYKEVDGKLIKWEDIPGFRLCDPPELGWERNRRHDA